MYVAINAPIAQHHHVIAAETRAHSQISPNPADSVEAEEGISLSVVADLVFHKDRPAAEILIPVSELHVETAVDRLVVHLLVEALPVGHRSLPLGSARRN